MDDLISRQMAIEAVISKTYEDGAYGYADAKELEDAINALPSEESEWIKPTGMMPPEYFGRYQCAKCNGWAMNDWKGFKTILTKFCPHCGRPMKNGDFEW